MITIPAIDLKNSQVVRLYQGDYNQVVGYDLEPEKIARQFEFEGASRIHIVDLDGALEGEPKNFKIIKSVIRAIKIPVEIGGGIRSTELIRKYLDIGAGWVILGTKACLDINFLQQALKEYEDRVIVGIDAKNGQVCTDGWTKVLDLSALDFAAKVEELGGSTVIYTDIAKDGALKGPNLSQINGICDHVKIDIIASGGVGQLSDLAGLMGLKKKNLMGVIVGKALYEKRFSFKEAVSACSQKE